MKNNVRWSRLLRKFFRDAGGISVVGSIMTYLAANAGMISTELGIETTVIFALATLGNTVIRGIQDQVNPERD